MSPHLGYLSTLSNEPTNPKARSTALNSLTPKVYTKDTKMLSKELTPIASHSLLFLLSSSFEMLTTSLNFPLHHSGSQYPFSITGETSDTGLQKSSVQGNMALSDGYHQEGIGKYPKN